MYHKCHTKGHTGTVSFTLLWGPLLNERASERVVVARVVRTIHSRSTFLVSMPPSLVSHGYPDQVPVRLITFQSCSWPLLLVPLLPILLPATFPHLFRCVAPEVSCMCTFSSQQTTAKRSHKRLIQRLMSKKTRRGERREPL